MPLAPDKVRVLARLHRGLRELDRLERDYLRWVKQGVPLPEDIHEFFRGVEPKRKRPGQPCTAN
jgi:hypothetical protein